MTAESRVRSSQEEALMIGQVLEGRQDLFCDLLRPHLPVLSRVVRAKMRNDPEAEDVVQQIVLKVFASLDRFRFEASFRTWLTRIAINEVLQWHRGHVASRFLALDQSALAQLQIVDQAFSPLKEYERGETARLVRGALAKLPEDYQVMIRLRDLEGRSVAETARLLRLSVPAAKTRHYRARLQMLRFLAPWRAAAPRPPAMDSRPALGAAPQRQTILAVDNQAINLELARSILEPSGYKVVIAFTMEDGLALARAGSCDLILSDACMSGGSGYDFLQAVKQDPRLRPVPFVLITSSMIDEKARIDGLALGATRFLCRPIEPELLLAEIRACLTEREDE